MHIYIYTHMYTYTYTYIHIHVYTHMCMYTHTCEQHQQQLMGGPRGPPLARANNTNTCLEPQTPKTTNTTTMSNHSIH